MELFKTVTDMGHERILFCHNQDSGLKAIIALHDTSLGICMGATRLWPYANEAEALNDVLRLSRGMSFKAACANIPVGGAKAVIISDPQHKNEDMLRDYGRFVESLQGMFVTGQDVNLSPQDIHIVRQETNHVVGISPKSKGPAPITAIGVFLGIKAALEFQLPNRDFDGLKVAVQGLGNVGENLCQLLSQRGAKLFVSDINCERTWKAQRLYDATIVDPKEIYGLDVDVFSPCALGGILNSTTIPQLKASIVAGSANNQLLDEQKDGQAIYDRGILYCPDYVINGGGLIDVYNELIGYEPERAEQHLHQIYDTLLEIFETAKQENITTDQASLKLAQKRIIAARESRKTATASTNGK